jgi:hypothetical protein
MFHCLNVSTPAQSDPTATLLLRQGELSGDVTRVSVVDVVLRRSWNSTTSFRLQKEDRIPSAMSSYSASAVIERNLQASRDQVSRGVGYGACGGGRGCGGMGGWWAGGGAERSGATPQPNRLGPWSSEWGAAPLERRSAPPPANPCSLRPATFSAPR